MKPAVNPCGHITDMIRDQYVAPFRFFSDSPDVTMVHWYKVPRDRPCLPVASIFQHECWNFDGPPKSNMHQGQPPFFQGEQYTAKYGGDKKPAGPLSVFTGHFCGSEEQWNGALSRGLAADIGTDACCVPHLPRNDGEGGVNVGGFHTVEFQRGLLGTGGVSEGGTSSVDLLRHITSAGGVLEGGYAVVNVPFLRGTGGVLEGGYATASGLVVVDGAGGVDVGGSSHGGFESAFVGLGGVVESGEGTVGLTPGFSSTGGVVEAGASSSGSQAGIASLGGITEAGGSVLSLQLGRIFVGGITEGGSATVTPSLGIRSVGGITEAGGCVVTLNGMVVSDSRPTPLP